MDMSRYEQINGREALKRLLAGERVLDALADEHFLDGTKLARVRKSGAFEIANDGLRRILERNWYIQKPFDVRQAMLERPNEWVAAYNDPHGAWIQVGFDTVNMRPTKAYHGYTGGVEGANGDFPTGYELETCIPIEDVPEEATR